MAKALYSHEFALVDLTMPDNQLLQHRRIAMLELTAKHIVAQFKRTARHYPALLTQDHLTDTQLSVLINYMLRKQETPREPGR